MFCFIAGVSVLDVLRALNEEHFVKQGVEEEEVFSLKTRCYKNVYPRLSVVSFINYTGIWHHVNSETCCSERALGESSSGWPEFDSSTFQFNSTLSAWNQPPHFNMEPTARCMIHFFFVIYEKIHTFLKVLSYLKENILDLSLCLLKLV